MNTYEYLADYLSQALGINYNISFNNNDSMDWDNILIDDMIHAVMHITGGQVGKISGSFVDMKSLMLQFAIPTDIEIFSEAVQNIDDKLKRLNGASTEYGGNSIQIGFEYISDAASLGAINGIKYAVISVYLSVLISDSVVFSNELEIKVDGAELKGIISAIPSVKHSFDSIVKSASNGKVSNYLNSIGYSLTINLTLRKDDNLHAKLLYEKYSNKEYLIKITYSDLYYTDSTGANIPLADEKTMAIADITISAILGDSLKAAITFVEV